MKFDIEMSSIYDRNNKWTRFLLRLTYFWYRIKTRRKTLINALMCHNLIQGLHRNFIIPDAYIALGGLTTLPDIINFLDVEPWQKVYIGGCPEEQEYYRNKLGNRDNITYLPTTTNTFAEIIEAVACIRKQGHKRIGVITHETHCVRAILTLIKQLMNGEHIHLCPFISIDPDHLAMPNYIQELGILREAEKIAFYQKKGNVATLQEAIKYFQAFS